jgi:hypothetical protein
MADSHDCLIAAGSGDFYGLAVAGYSTVTDFARFRGWSTSQPRSTAA